MYKLVKRYNYNDVKIETKTVNIFDCPDCGFEFNAYHEVDDQVGGWECPLCEIDELKEKIDRYENALKEIVNAPEDIMLSEHSRLADRVAKEALGLDD